MKQIIAFFLVISLYSCSSDEDNSKQNPQNLNFTQLFSITADTLDLDMIGNSSENSLYLTYSTDNGFNENVLKYNLTTQTPLTITHPDDTESRQIENIGNWIYSISKNDVYRYDLDLDNVSIFNEGNTGLEYHKTITVNNDILSQRGKNLEFKYNTTANDYTLPDWQETQYRFKADCELFSNKIYSFGGTEFNTAYNTINIHNLTDNSWTQETLPFNAFETFTDIYNNAIIIAGNKNLNSGNAFIGTYDPVTNNYTSIPVSLDLSSISIRSITVLNNELYIAYTDIVTPLPSSLTIKIAKATLP